MIDWLLRRRPHKIAVSKDKWRVERAFGMYVYALENAWKWAALMRAIQAIQELNRGLDTAAFFGRMDVDVRCE